MILTIIMMIVSGWIKTYWWQIALAFVLDLIWMQIVTSSNSYRY